MSEETNKLLESIIAYQMVLKKQIVQYEERIDKAIEYIKYWTQDDGIILSWESVIKILEGEEVE